MTWVRLDDVFPSHPKIVDLSDRAFRMHIQGLCYSAHALTDGRIPERIAHGFGRDSKRFANELVSKGVWARIGNAYEIHDYSDYQPSREDVLHQRAQTASRVARWRDRKRTSNSVTPDGGNGVSNGAPVPTRPHIPPNPRTAGERDLEQIDPQTAIASTGTPRENGTNPRARNHRAKAQRAHDLFVDRTVGLYHQWLAEPDRTPEGVAHEIRQAYPDIAEEVLAKVNT